MIKKLTVQELEDVIKILEKEEIKLENIKKESVDKPFTHRFHGSHIYDQEMIVKTLTDIRNAIVKDGEALIESHEQKMLGMKNHE